MELHLLGCTVHIVPLLLVVAVLEVLDSSLLFWPSYAHHHVW
jgi:hypothetical protein